MAISLNSKTYNFAGFTAPLYFTQYWERSGTYATSFSPLTVKVDAINKAGQSKVRWKLKVPIVATESTECACVGSVIDEDIVDIVITNGKGTTSARRADILARVQALVLTSEFTGSVNNLVQPSA